MTSSNPPEMSDQSRSILSVLERMSVLLSEAGVDPHPDAELLLAHVLGESRGKVQVLALMGTELTEPQHDAALELAATRAERIPLQHLTGKAAFRRLELEVGPGVFVPRPETEIVTQFALDALAAAADPHPIAVDLCTGSGAIALSLAHELPTAEVWAVEKSREAHAWAERNVDTYGDGRVHLMLGDAAEARTLLDPLAGRVHVLVSNPPYVPSGMVPREPEVRDHDPELALYSGADGLDLIRVISVVARDLVTSGGTLVLEHAELQGSAIRRILSADGWRATATHQDLTMRDRVTTAVR